jgi:adenine-specific DNA-methyltransferase
LRGGYYTPEPIAEFMANWAIQSSQTSVLEPSCGDGVFIEASLKALSKRGASKRQAIEMIRGVEIDECERQKALERAHSSGYSLTPSAIRPGDFFTYCQQNLPEDGLLPFEAQKSVDRFDVVIGNPPFIRYQNFAEEHRKPAFEIMQRAGATPNRLTNSWVPFVIASAFMLTDTGRLAMVIPAELMQVNYAAELRRFLSDYFNKITLVTFRRLVFQGIQQEVVLLLVERNGGGNGGIRAVELDDVSDLASYQYSDFVNRELKPMDHSTEKWTQYFLNKKEIGLLRALQKEERISRTGELMEVDVGIVTGQNQFFVLNEEQVKERSLKRYTHRIVSRSGHLSGIIFTDEDWQSNLRKNLPGYLITLPDKPIEELPSALQDYIQFGEKLDFHTGFKCRIRNRWYIVPSVWTPDAFLLRQVHGYPRIILNAADATCTDTIHRVRFRAGADGRTVAPAFMNSLTFAFSEVIGRSYGGGVLELEPNEAEKLPLPLKLAEKLNHQEINAILMKDGIEAVLAQTDQLLLIDGLGLSRAEVKSLHQIWRKMSERRIKRKHSPNGRKAVIDINGVETVAQAA